MPPSDITSLLAVHIKKEFTTRFAKFSITFEL
jgi:hypothetical protein